MVQHFFFLDLADVYVDRKMQHFITLPNVGQIIFRCRTFFLNETNTFLQTLDTKIVTIFLDHLPLLKWDNVLFFIHNNDDHNQSRFPFPVCLKFSHFSKFLHILAVLHNFCLTTNLSQQFLSLIKLIGKSKTCTFQLLFCKNGDLFLLSF